MPAQLCFYDPGLGSHPDTGEIRTLFRRITLAQCAPFARYYRR